MYGSITATEALDSGLGVIFPALLVLDHRSQNLAYDVPELFVIFLEKDEGAGGLGVEGGGAVGDGVLDDFLDAFV